MSDEAQQKAIFKDIATQQALNAPLKVGGAMPQDDREFMDLVMELINGGKIDLYKPDTLLNRAVYDGLTHEDQGKADLEAVNILAALREMKGLHDSGNKETYQMQNLVSRVKNTKERLEEQGGDLFII